MAPKKKQDSKKTDDKQAVVSTTRSTRSKKEDKVEVKVQAVAKKVEPVVKKVETVVKGKKGKPVVALPILVPIAVVAAAVVPDNKKPVKANKISPPSKKAKLADAPVVAQAPIVKIPPPSKKVKVAATPVVVQAPIVVPAPIVDVKDNKKELVKGGASVDDFVPNHQIFHVYNANGKIYDCTMNQTNIMDSNNNNKFYIVQMLETDANPKQHYVFNRWGRVGAMGQFGLKGPWSIESCFRDYQHKVHEKSVLGDYRILERDFAAAKTTDPAVSQKQQDDAFGSSALHLKVKELVQLIFDLKMINKQMMEIGYDAKKMPLGRLAKTTIEKGFGVLEQISQAVKQKSSLADFQRLSSEFYSQIPHNFGLSVPPVIKTVAEVKAKLEMLESIQQIQVATKILEDDSKAGDANILDTHYEKLACKIGWIAPGSKKYIMLESYVKNTHAKTHSNYSLDVLEIFELNKELDKTRFTKDLGNRRLLWHGSRLTNFVGILSQGLRIAPPEAPVTGYMFGKGVYFADMVSKSANYCGTSRQNDVGMLLLCDVALGEMNDKYEADYNASTLPDGKHSTRGMGKTAPHESSYVDDEGCKVPLGEGVPTNINRGSLLYNEYIVYDIKQIQFRYLIKLKYNYK